MKFRRWLVSGLAPLILSLPAASAQETVEGRLLQILHEKGIISDAQLAELRAVETRMRDESDLASELEGRIDELVAGMQDDAVSTSYRVGRGFTFTTADKRFSLNLGGRLQVRFTYEFFDDDDDEPDFSVPRARVWLQGNVFEAWMKYKFQFDIAGDEADTSVMGSTLSSRNRLTEVKDAYFDMTKWKAFSIRGGQFKAPYSRHQLTSSGSLEFVDRSITDAAFAPGRQVGVMVHGMMGGEKDDLFEYYMGVFNGEGENRFNDDEGMMLVGRVAFNPFGGVKYTESDLGDTQDFLMAVGINGWYHMDDNFAGNPDDWSIGADVVAMYRRFFFLAEVHYREDGQAGADQERLGWFAQAGYFLIPHELEVGVRFADIRWDESSTESQREYLLVLGYFWHEHNMKFQADFGRVELDRDAPAADVDQWRLRLQFQLIF